MNHPRLKPQISAKPIIAVTYKAGDKPSGGMGVVVKAIKPHIIFGASPDALGANQHISKTGKPYPLTLEGETTDYNIVNFAVTEPSQQDHYGFSNDFLWPMSHSMPLPKGLNVGRLEAMYEGFCEYNHQHNIALTAYVSSLTKMPLIWVHDYQSLAVRGDMFSWHVPFPRLSYLRQTLLENTSGKKQSIINLPLFRDYLTDFIRPKLSSFQRHSDAVNVMMAIAYLHAKTDTPCDFLPAGFDIRQADDEEAIYQHLMQHLPRGEVIKINAFGQKTHFIAVPVGRDVAETFAAAQSGEFETVYNGVLKDALFRGITSSGGANEAPSYAELNVCGLNPDAFSQHAPSLEDVIAPLADRLWLMAIHRNDYTKGTRRLLTAYERYLGSIPAKRRENKTLFLCLQPTRGGVEGYREYAETVLRKVASIQAAFGGQSVIVIPGVAPNDVLRLMRRPEARVYLAPSFRDGFSLMPTEFIASNADTIIAKGVITSTGTGNSDIIWNGEEGDKRQGAHVVHMPTHFAAFNTPEGLTEAASQIHAGIEFIFNRDNAEKVKADFAYMKSRIEQFDAQNFNDVLLRAFAECE